MYKMNKSILILLVMSVCLSIISARHPRLSTFCKVTHKSHYYTFERIRTQICNPDIEYSWCGIVDKVMPIMCTFFNEPATTMVKRTYLDDLSDNYNNLDLDQQEANLDLYDMKHKRDLIEPNTIGYDCCTFNCSANYILEFYCEY